MDCKKPIKYIVESAFLSDCGGMSKPINMAELRSELNGLFEVRPLVYWTDFLLNLTIGYFCFFYSLKLPLTPLFFTLILVSSFTLYRAVIFIHEIAHARLRLPIFTVVWNLLCGIPLGLPSFIYYQSHLLHHHANTYGTDKDGEYIPFNGLPHQEILKYFVLSALAPFLMIGRFSLLTFPSYFIPSLRRWLVRHGSSLVIETKFVGEFPQGRDKIDWFYQEPLTALVWTGIMVGLACGKIPLNSFLCFLGLMCFLQLVNAVRTLAAHRWLNGSLKTLTFEQQYLDSTNLMGKGVHGLINTLVAPVGLRYHALHHLFQGLPYHALGEAHARLSDKLPKESNFFLADEISLYSALKHLWKRTDPVPRVELPHLENNCLT